MIKYVVSESFEFESFDKTIWHLSKGYIISYEFYTDNFDLHYSEPVAFEENNAIKILVHSDHGSFTFSGPAIDIKKYVNEIPIVKSTDYYLKKEQTKHLQVYQFDNLDKMNDKLSKYDEKDIISITPVKVTTNAGIGYVSEDNIIYCVTVRE